MRKILRKTIPELRNKLEVEKLRLERNKEYNDLKKELFNLKYSRAIALKKNVSANIYKVGNYIKQNVQSKIRTEKKVKTSYPKQKVNKKELNPFKFKMGGGL